MTQILFVFRRDLRLEDNTALNAALATGKPVACAFIIDPRQFDPHPYQSVPGKRFLIESLRDLATALTSHGGKLQLIRGEAENVIPSLMKELKCEQLFFNRDYTPFSRRRDERLAAAVSVQSFDDALINAPHLMLKDNGTPYTVFTPYYKKALTKEILKPHFLAKGTFSTMTAKDCISAEQLSFDFELCHPEGIPGGRSQGLKALEDLARHKNYDHDRDLPALRGTTQLSPHHKFGTISIRESAARAIELFGKNSILLKEFYWRDFFTQIAFHFPHIFEGAFHRAYDRVKWIKNDLHFSAWCNGMTGFPIVDAGMRQLNATGWMHNRVRMIVASFLTKDLHISWRDGERYFAQHLVDYDPAVNNGSWQWASSSGCDAQPYFRIFNPWLQQQKFDPQCLYIKKWLPELAALSAKEIHELAEQRPPTLKGYPAPIVEHGREKRITEELYSEALKKS